MKRYNLFFVGLLLFSPIMHAMEMEFMELDDQRGAFGQLLESAFIKAYDTIDGKDTILKYAPASDTTTQLYLEMVTRVSDSLLGSIEEWDQWISYDSKMFAYYLGEKCSVYDAPHIATTVYSVMTCPRVYYREHLFNDIDHYVTFETAVLRRMLDVSSDGHKDIMRKLCHADDVLQEKPALRDNIPALIVGAMAGQWRSELFQEQIASDPVLVDADFCWCPEFCDDASNNDTDESVSLFKWIANLFIGK